MNDSKTIGMGVIGLGHWGPNHLRIFSQCAGVRMVAASWISRRIAAGTSASCAGTSR